jgi:hypothetical protein
MTAVSRFISSILLTIVAAASLHAQVTSQATPAPIVTAESEAWYLDGGPITYSGHFYYPSGAQIHFNANEMVRSGFYEGIPLYVRTTLEPYSIVFVPLAGGMMQPYERRRDGELAGTAGSTTPSLPGVSTSEDNADRSPQAAAPPTLVGNVDRGGSRPVSPVATQGSSSNPPPAPISTSGAFTRRPYVAIGPKPQGINAIFMEFEGRRWYAAGPAVTLDPATMTRIGERHGFAVFADVTSPGNRIYMQVVAGGSMVAPYSITRPSAQEH